MTKVFYEQKADIPKTDSSKPVRETQQRGTIVFPLQYNLCNTENPSYDLWMHWHTEFEIIHIISGTYNISLENQDFHLSKGDLCIIPGKMIHGDAPVKGSSLYESIVFDIELLRLHSFSPDLFINDILNGNTILENQIKFEKDSDFAQTTDILFSVLKGKPNGYDIISAGLLMVLFGLIKKHGLYSEKRTMPAHKRIRSEQLDLVLNLIRKNYDQNLTLEEMSKIAGLSPKYFCRIFREMTERSPIEYLNWFRVNRACALLRETNDKLPDIAFNCGFNDFSYFIKTFRRYKGMTPLKYRNFDPLRDKNSAVELKDDDSQFEE